MVPPEESEQMVAAIKRCGGSPRLTIYPDADHDSWIRTYDNPELYEGLLGSLGSEQGDFPYYVCPVCGHTVGKGAPDICPVCGTAGSAFKKID